VRTDAWTAYPGLSEAGYRHDVPALGGDPDKAEAHLPTIHLVFVGCEERDQAGLSELS
jgi:hypothetical protein